MNSSWQKRAACAGTGPEPFFPTKGATTTRPTIRDFCNRCPVTRQCLAYGLKEKYGIWGGKTVTERAELRRHNRYIHLTMSSGSSTGSSDQTGAHT